MQTRQRLIEQIIRNILLESNAEENVDRQFEQGRMSGIQAFGEPSTPKPSPKPKKPRTREEKQQIARQRQEAIQASIDAENHSRAVAAGFPNWDAYMDSYRNDPRMDRLKQTNEETLHELYGLAGLYARSIGNKRELSPEEEARGDNPYLNPDGSTVYHNSPLAKALGGAEYVRLGSESVIKMTDRVKSLAGTTRQMIKSILSGRVRGAKGEPMTPEQAVSMVKPRTQEVTRLIGTPEKLGKIGRRTERMGRVVQDTRDILNRLPQPKPQKPPEPPEYYA